MPSPWTLFWKFNTGYPQLYLYEYTVKFYEQFVRIVDSASFLCLWNYDDKSMVITSSPPRIYIALDTIPSKLTRIAIYTVSGNATPKFLPSIANSTAKLEMFYTAIPHGTSVSTHWTEDQIQKLLVLHLCKHFALDQSLGWLKISQWVLCSIQP